MNIDRVYIRPAHFRLFEERISDAFSVFVLGRRQIVEPQRRRTNLAGTARKSVPPHVRSKGRPNSLIHKNMNLALLLLQNLLRL